jgi:spore coat protein B
MKDAYFSSLIGRSVQVYKGGPNSNVGRLLDVSGDYLALQKDDGEVIYYKTSHIKSIREDSQIRFNSALNAYDSTNFLQAPTFNELAANFKGLTIRINGNGPESKVGKLIDVKSDFMILHTKKDGLIFFNEQHITSLSFVGSNSTGTDENESSNATTEEQEAESGAELSNLMEDYNLASADNSKDLLTNLKYCWIKINRKGPESIEGMLVEANEDHLVLVVDNEIFRIATFHVKNFSVSLEKPKEQTNEQNDDNEQQDTNEKNDKNNKNKKNDNNSQEKTGEKAASESQNKKNQSKETQTNDANQRETQEEYLNRMARRKRMHMKKKNAQQTQANVQSTQAPDKKASAEQATEQKPRENTPTSSPSNIVKKRKAGKSTSPVEAFRKKQEK